MVYNIYKIKEKAELDKVFRDKAVTFTQNIKNFLSSNMDELIQRDSEYGEPWINKDFKRNEWGGYTLDYGAMFPEDNIDIQVILLPENSKLGGKGDYQVTASLGKTKSGETALLLPMLLGNWDLTYANTRLQEKILVHELIHYFDTLRSGEVKTSADAFNTQTIKDYYNNPHEYNAYVQEALYDLDGYFRHQVFIDKKMSTWNDFYKLAIDTVINKEFFNHLNTTYLKKLQKRLYDYYQSKIKESQ